MIDPNVYIYERFIQRGASLPELKIKKKWQKVADAMSWHIDGVYPEELIDKRRPKEDEERRCFRRDNYEPITMGDMTEAINGLKRIFDSRNYNIRVSDRLEVYIAEKRFEAKSFINFVEAQLFISMLGDPNGIVAVLPGGLRFREDGTNDTSLPVEPTQELVPSENIYDRGDDYLLYKSREKTAVLYSNRTELIGDVFYLLTTQTVYKIVQFGKKTDNNYRVEWFYQHGQGELPIVTLGGNWNSKGRYFESFFSGCVAWGNEALKCHSDRVGTTITCAYPTKIMTPQDCPVEECINGWLDLEHTKKCQTCGGSGKVVSTSPYGVFLKPERNPALGEQQATESPLQYVSPPTDILRFQAEDEKMYFEKFRAALHLTTVAEGESGLAKAIDHEREYAFISTIATNVFDHIIYGLLWIMERYMNITSPELPLIIKPSEFALRTEAALIAELSTLKTANAPVAVINEVLLELMKRRYAGNDAIFKKHELLMEYDPLYSYNIEEKAALLGIGAVTKEDVAKSLNAPPALDAILRDRTQAIEYDQYPQLFTALDAALQPKLDALSAGVVPILA